LDFAGEKEKTEPPMSTPTPAAIAVIGFIVVLIFEGA
jgi:hypothetical protein